MEARLPLFGLNIPYVRRIDAPVSKQAHPRAVYYILWETPCFEGGNLYIRKYLLLGLIAAMVFMGLVM